MKQKKPNDEALIATLSEQDPEFKALVKNHRNLDEELNELDGRPYLNDDEQMYRKKLQKEKLLKKDQIEVFLAKHR